ncbi:hypothetical protein OOT46_07275 [Aquabacterium sp. A7-Y]|uniref:PEP-CTERM sorting domain-containing protein n=1 Tax=Aquabacterium sp. A7-Y TaxID=1349605 RepID=UPI00223CA3F1|nr:PEP-CTERM sorting domain-containing protein [Aquabacterium sp. A7-Y]MCW7537652.1 hypothetical protein [Aquabacterium sp. A7-Y]
MNRKIAWAVVLTLAGSAAALWHGPMLAALPLNAEPDVYGLVFSGLGVAAWVARRRRPG